MSLLDAAKERALRCVMRVLLPVPAFFLLAACEIDKPAVDPADDSSASGPDDTGEAEDTSGADDTGAAAGCGPSLGGTAWAATSNADAPLILTPEGGGDQLALALAGAGDFDGDGCDDILLAARNYDAQNGAVYVVSGTTRGSVSVGGAGTRFDGAQYDAAGQSVAGGADVDEDGRADVLIGATGEAAGYDTTGRVYLLLGGQSGTIQATGADFTFTGDAEASFVGSAVAWARDLDADGVADAVIGARGVDGLAGAVYLVSGARRGNLGPDDAIATLRATGGRVWAGADLAAIGDNDGDGFDDVIVGASGSAEGAAWVFRGPFDADRTTEDADSTIRVGAYTGFSVAAVGDVAGDGRDGVLVAWLGSEDQVGLFGGDLEGEVGRDDAIATFSTDVEQFSAGVGMAGPGDLDGDGYADVAIGAPGATTGYNQGAPGGVYLFAGPVRGSFRFADVTTWSEGTTAGSAYGATVAAGGDLDGDGLADLLAGAWAEGSGGQAYAFGGGPR